MSGTDSDPFQRALAHIQAGDLDAAGQICAQILQRDSRSASTWNLLGIVSFSKGQFGPSLTAFSNAVQLSPRDAHHHNNLGMAYQALGHQPNALASYRQAVELDPAFAAAYDNLGNCFCALQRFDEAIPSHQRAIELNPQVAAPHNNLGSSYLALGKLTEATSCFERALELSPRYAAAYNNLGTVLLRQGRLPEAAEHFQRSIEIEPSGAEAYNNLGEVRRRELGYADAADLFRRAIELQPYFVDALVNLGAVLLVLNNDSLARAYFQRALQARPASAEIFDRIGNAWRMHGELDEAYRHFEQAVRLDSNLASAHANLGATWHARGLEEQAIACYRRALALNPQLTFAHTSLAQALVAIGNRGAAFVHLSEAIEIEPENAQAHWLLAANHSRALEDRIVKRMERLLADANRSEEDRCFLHFALAHSFDKAGDCDRAVKHAHQANDLRKRDLQRRGYQFDRVAQVAFVDEMIALYTPDFFAAARDFGVASNLPIFIVGMPRSGTTVVEQILASHSQVFGAGELNEMTRIHPDLRKRFAALSGTRDTAASVRSVAQAHLKLLERLGGSALRVVDKMPTNFEHLGMIATLFPNSHVIHCVRDSRNVLLSCYFQNFSAETMSFACDMEDLTAYFQQYERLMNHWRTVLPLKIQEVSYEQLVQDQENVSRQLIGSCGLAWEAGCLDFHKTKRTIATASASQVREPLHANSVARWRRYEPHIDLTCRTV